MKKLVKRIKNIHLPKQLLFFYLLIPVIVVSVKPYKVLDNDRFFLISLGRSIINNGFPKYDPLSMHVIPNFIAQQWLVDVLFYGIHKYFGDFGLVILAVILLMVIIFVFYSLCNLLSKERHGLNTIITLLFSVFYLLCYLTTRPQLFEAIILLLEVYFLEKYIDKKNKKYLYFLPILSLLLINIHASCFLMLFAFILPYILNIKTKYTENDNYKVKPIIIISIIMFLTGFINPYGYKAITYIFSSYGIDTINKLVLEMLPLTLNNTIGYMVYGLLLVVILIYILRRKKIKIRYLFLLLGTTYLALSHVKGAQYFLLGSIFPLADYLKDLFIVSKKEVHKDVRTFYYITLAALIAFPIFNLIRNRNYPSGSSEPVKILEYINSQVEDKEGVKIYTDYNTGGFFEFNGYKPYMDPRAEVFIENGVLKEFYNIEEGTINYQDFIDKYDFDYIVVDSGNLFTRHYLATDKNKRYILVLNEITDEKKYVGYTLYQKVS